MPKISLVAPVYGVENYIHQFLDSIRKQTFRDFEVILVDDGSKDRCPQILDEFAKEDARYRVIHQENGGVSKARNAGLEQVQGQYVYIADSDDWLEPTALEELWRAAEQTGADIIYGDWVREKKAGPQRLYCFPHEFVTQDPATLQVLQFGVNSNNYRVKIRRPEFSEIRHLGGAPWRGMFKTAVIQENGLRYDPYVKGLGDDILFSLHLYEYVKKVAYVQKVIYHYRVVEASYSHGFKANYLTLVANIFEKQEEFLQQYHKGELAWQAYYNRVLIYLLSGMQRYFRNSENKKTETERYQEFLDVIHSEPYRTAIRKAPLQYIGMESKKFWLTTFLLKCKMNKLYWKLSAM